MSSNSQQPPSYQGPIPQQPATPPPPSQTPTYMPGQLSPQRQYANALRTMQQAGQGVSSRNAPNLGNIFKRDASAFFNPLGIGAGGPLKMPQALGRVFGIGSNPNIGGKLDLESGTVNVKGQGKNSAALNEMFTNYLRGMGPRPTGGKGAYSKLNKKIDKAIAGGYKWEDPNAPGPNAPNTMGGPGFSPNAPGRLMWNRVPEWYSKKYGG